MATIKLDDLFGKKTEVPQVLDLSRSTIQSKEEFQRLLDKVPEYKIRPEKVSLTLKELILHIKHTFACINGHIFVFTLFATM